MSERDHVSRSGQVKIVLRHTLTPFVHVHAAVFSA